jgi:hypothetical protein
MAQTQLTKIVTPKGIAMYPWLNTGKPDTKFNADGEYKVTLKVPAEDAAPLIAQLADVLTKYQNEQSIRDPKIARYTAAPPYEEEVDDQGNLTGNYLFKFKQRARVNTKDGRTLDMKITLVDATRTPTQVSLGGGSEIKIAATIWPYALSTNKTVGLSLRPNAVQIISLVEFKSKGTADLFSDEEGFTTTAANQVSAPMNEEYDTAADF